MKKTDEKHIAATLERRAKQAFDDSVDALDAATLSKLNRGRQAALAELDQSRRFGRWSAWTPALGVSAAVLFAILIVNPMNKEALIEAPNGDFEILMSEERLDMLEELEFYAWLESVDLEAVDEVG